MAGDCETAVLIGNDLTAALGTVIQAHPVLSAERLNLISARASQRTWPARRAAGGRWLGVLTALVFVLQINYVRFHLLTETHLAVVYVASPPSPAPDGGYDEGDHHGSDQHERHSALDHLVQMVAKHKASLLADAFIPSETSIRLTLPDSQVLRMRYASGKAPGESPPDPMQPRAPPFA